MTDGGYTKAKGWNLQLQARIDELEAEVSRLRVLLGTAAKSLASARSQFAIYTQVHRAKGTPDGDHKARTNEAFANEMNAALAAIRESER